MIFNCVKKMESHLKIYLSGMLFLFSEKSYSMEGVVTQVIKSDSIIKSGSIATDPMSGGYLMQLILGLLVVVLCIVALAWFAKKMNRFNSITDDSLKIISGISMGSRERIVLLQVGDEQLLVGVSPGRINKLHVLNSSITTSSENVSNAKNSSTDKGFAEKLKTMMADASFNSSTNGATDGNADDNAKSTNKKKNQ